MPAHVISFLVGLLSLGAETLWVRTYGFANETRPTAFAVVLAVYLLGIAIGAAKGAEICRKAKDLREAAAKAILAASALIALSPVLIVALPHFPILLPPLIFLPSFFFSICFPICHQLGTRLDGNGAGKSLSRVYASNILGSVAGPLLTNFVILNWMTTQMAFVTVGGLGMGAAFLLARADRLSPALRRAAAAGCALVACLLAVVAAMQSRPGAMGNLLLSSLDASEGKYGEIKRVVETRQGAIASYGDDKNGDVIFGGNVYDGRTNVDPRIDSNRISRIIMLQAIAPAPRRVLIIGLSIGSWQHIVTGFPGVEHIDVVEINPGYLELARDYPIQDKAIHDPRVNLVIGDGRKFLRRNPAVKYDLVVMNTTFHWRMYTSLLLSRQFLTMVRSHMTPEAVLAFNTTGSVDALKTAATVFPHAYLYQNFAVASETDWRPRLAEASAGNRLREIAFAGDPLFKPEDGDVIAKILAPKNVRDLETLEKTLQSEGQVITDRNLITEYRTGELAIWR